MGGGGGGGRGEEISTRETPSVVRMTKDIDRLERLAVLGTLSGAIAHELNNLLTPILTYSQMALAAPHDRELRQKALQRAVANSERASRIISSILALSRDEQFVRPEGAVGEAAEPARALVGECVREAAAGLPDLGERDIRLEVEVASGLWVAMRPVALQQVLGNLMLNAVEAMPRGGVLRVSADAPAGAGVGGGEAWRRSIVISVRDEGQGVEPGRMTTLFGAGIDSGGGETGVEHLAGAGVAGARRGRGLGLMIARSLIAEAGGRIGATSEVGRGTEVVVLLPRARLEIRESA